MGAAIGRWAGISGGLAAGLWAGRHCSSSTVRNWQPSSVPTTMAGRLRVRVSGTGPRTTVLLHGMVGSGDYFGARYGASSDESRIVVVDLLGFGGSYTAAAPSGYGLTAHLNALDEMAEVLQIDGPLTIFGHSMGAALALHWAATRGAQVERVVALSAPLYLSRQEALSHIRRLGPFEALMAVDTPISRKTCAWMCRHRDAAGWIAVATRPSLPIPIARNGTLHTWPAYLESMEGIVLDSRWQDALSTLSNTGTPVLLANGARDPVPVTGRTDALADSFTNIEHLVHPTAGHDLPLADPAWCLDLLTTHS